MNTFSASAALRFGWKTFIKRPWFLIGVTLLIFALTWITGAIQQIPQAQWPVAVILFIVSLALSTFVDMGWTAVVLRAHDDVAHTALNDLWHPRPFWNYLGVSILVGTITIVGFILLIVPGVILALMYAFVKFIVIERGLDPIAAMKESARITYGSRLELLLLFVMLIGINILGLIALIVGLLVTLPVSMLALAHAYRTLTRKTPHTHPNTTQIPMAPQTYPM